MRALITSIISLALLIGCWGIFYHYSDENLNGIITECEDVVMAAIQNENTRTKRCIFSTHSPSTPPTKSLPKR